MRPRTSPAVPGSPEWLNQTAAVLRIHLSRIGVRLQIMHTNPKLNQKHELTQRPTATQQIWKFSARLRWSGSASLQKFSASEGVLLAVQRVDEGGRVRTSIGLDSFIVFVRVLVVNSECQLAREDSEL